MLQLAKFCDQCDTSTLLVGLKDRDYVTCVIVWGYGTAIKTRVAYTRVTLLGYTGITWALKRRLLIMTYNSILNYHEGYAGITWVLMMRVLIWCVTGVLITTTDTMALPGF